MRRHAEPRRRPGSENSYVSSQYELLKHGRFYFSPSPRALSPLNVDMEQFWILNYVARMNLFDAPTDIGISVIYMFSRISDFIPPMKTNVICHATPRTEIEFGAIAHGHGRFYVRPPYGKIASPKCAWRRFGFRKRIRYLGVGRLYHDMFPFRNG